MEITWVSKEKLFSEAISKLYNVDILLDIGCGIRPQKLTKPKVHICCEPFDEYVQRLQKIERDCDNIFTIIKVFWGDVINLFPEKSIDSVYLLDVIEHLDKNEGLTLLRKTEKICKEQLVIFTPLGFMPQHHEDNIDAWGLSGGQFQEHKSGWLPSDFDESWNIIACKDFHDKDFLGEKTETIYGAFFAIKNFNTIQISKKKKKEKLLKKIENIRNPIFISTLNMHVKLLDIFTAIKNKLVLTKR